MSENIIIRNGIRYRKEDAIRLGFIKPNEEVPAVAEQAKVEAKKPAAKKTSK